MTKSEIGEVSFSGDDYNSMKKGISGLERAQPQLSDALTVLTKTSELHKSEAKERRLMLNVLKHLQTFQLKNYRLSILPLQLFESA